MFMLCLIFDQISTRNLGRQNIVMLLDFLKTSLKQTKSLQGILVSNKYKPVSNRAISHKYISAEAKYPVFIN